MNCLERLDLSAESNKLLSAKWSRTGLWAAVPGIVLALLVVTTTSLDAQVNFGAPFDQPSFSPQFTNTSVGATTGAFATSSASMDFRTIGGDFLIPVEFGFDGPGALQLGAHYGWYSVDVGGSGDVDIDVDMPNPILVDVLANWDITHEIVEESDVRFVFTTGAEVIHIPESEITATVTYQGQEASVSERTSSATRIDFPARGGFSYPIQLSEEGNRLIPGAALTTSLYYVTVGDDSDFDVQFYFDIGATYRFPSGTGVFLTLRLDDERFGDDTRIRLGSRFGI